MNEGQRVAYVGEDTMVGVGALGKVLASAGSSQHVQWLEGDRAGQVDLVPNEDLVDHRTAKQAAGTSVAAEFEDALDVPAILSVAVRETYDNYGEEGLLNALDEAGHLATLSEYAGEAISHVAGRLRQDPDFSAVLGQLDEFEAESLLIRVAVNLLAPDTSDEDGD